MPKTSSKITIVGAGLVGSLWAVLLRRRGLEVDIYERRPDPRLDLNDAGRSINLVITSRGLNALKTAGLLDKVNPLAVPVFGRMIHSRAGELAYQAYGQEGECNFSISRAALNRFLLDEADRAGAKLFFEHEIEDVDVESRRAVFRTPEGERAVSYDVLFGTDGAGSRVRRALLRRKPELFREDIQWLEADYKELTIPRDPQETLRQDALHIWPRGGHMMMALANRDGSFTATVYLPKASAPVAFEGLKSASAVRSLFESEFADAIPLMPYFENEFLTHPQGSLGTVRTSRWVFDGSVALMGDAAHAIVPFFGQGMNSGFEDCTTLLSLWEKTGDWTKALPEFERIQKPNADAIADMALENWTEMRDKVGDPRFLFRKKVEGELERRFPGLFKSRYGLITYTLTPYAVARQAGLLQDSLFARLMEGRDDLHQIDWTAARTLFETEWTPFAKSAGVLIRYG